MGIIPLQYKAGDTAESLGLTGTEQFSVNLPEELKPRQNIMVRTIFTVVHVWVSKVKIYIIKSSKFLLFFSLDGH